MVRCALLTGWHAKCCFSTPQHPHDLTKAIGMAMVSPNTEEKKRQKTFQEPAHIELALPGPDLTQCVCIGHEGCHKEELQYYRDLKGYLCRKKLLTNR